MGKSKYDAIRIAKQLCYSETTINRIKTAKQKTKLHGFYMMQGRQWNDTESNNISRL